MQVLICADGLTETNVMPSSRGIQMQTRRRDRDKTELQIQILRCIEIISQSVS